MFRATRSLDSLNITASQQTRQNKSSAPRCLFTLAGQTPLKGLTAPTYGNIILFKLIMDVEPQNVTRLTVLEEMSVVGFFYSQHKIGVLRVRFSVYYIFIGDGEPLKLQHETGQGGKCFQKHFP